jgi:hypothetical protein
MVNIGTHEGSFKRRLELEGESSSKKNQKLNDNSTSPIESIPDELLVQIFQHLSLLYWGKSTSLVNRQFFNCTNLAYGSKTTFFNLNMLPEHYRCHKNFFLHQGKKFINLKELGIRFPVFWTKEEKKEMISFLLTLLVQNEKTLRCLHLNGDNDFTISRKFDVINQQIAKCQKLKTLALAYIKLSKGAGEDLGAALPHLKSCQLECVVGVQHFLSTLAQSSLKLKKFHLQTYIMDQDLVDPLKKLFQNSKELSNFKYLSVDDNGPVSDDSAIDHLVNQFLPELKCRSLKDFSCRIPAVDNPGLFRQELTNLISRSPNLESFSLHGGYSLHLNHIPLQELIASNLKFLCLTRLSSDNDKDAEKKLIETLCASVHLEKVVTSQKLSAISLKKLTGDAAKVRNFSFLINEDDLDEEENYNALLELAQAAFEKSQTKVTIDYTVNID